MVKRRFDRWRVITGRSTPNKNAELSHGDFFAEKFDSVVVSLSQYDKVAKIDTGRFM